MKSNNTAYMEGDNTDLLENQNASGWADARESWFFFASLAVVIAYVVVGFVSESAARYLR